MIFGAISAESFTGSRTACAWSAMNRLAVRWTARFGKRNPGKGMMQRMMKRETKSAVYATRSASAMRCARWAATILLAALCLHVDAQAPNAAALSGGPFLTPYGAIAAGAPVRVCLITAGGSPCSTAGVTLYSDYNLTQPISNPTSLNSQGIYGVFTTAGSYMIQIQVAPAPAAPYVFYISASSGGGGGSVSGQAANVVPLATDATTIGAQSHLDEITAGFDTFTQPTVAPGMEDTNRPTVNTSSLLTGVGGATDECAKMQQLSINADGASPIYTVNNLVSSGNSSNNLINCKVRELFDPALFSTGGPPYTSSNVVTLNQAQVNTLGEVDIPAISHLQGNHGSGGLVENLAGTSLSVTSNFVTPPYGSTYPTVGLNLGPPLETLTSGSFSIGSSVSDLAVNCAGAPNMIAIASIVGQQGTSATNVGSRNCAVGLDISNISGFTGAGGTQNGWNFDYGSWTVPNGPTTQGIDGAIITAAGSGYFPTQLDPVIVTASGCTTPPTLKALTVAGGLTGIYSAAPNWNGVCPATGVTLSFSGAGGTGAAATPTIGSTMTPVGVAIGNFSGAGTVSQRIQSVVAGSTTNRGTGYTIDSSGYHGADLYCESLPRCVNVGFNTSGILGNIILERVIGQSAQNPITSDIDMSNRSTIESIAILASGGTGARWAIRDNHLNGGYLPVNQYNLNGYSYFRGHWYVMSDSGDVTTNTPHGTSFHNCNTGSDSGCLLPWQYVPAFDINGHISSGAAGNQNLPKGIFLNGRFDTTSTDATSVVEQGDAPCVFDPAALPVAGDAVTLASNNTINSGAIAGCADTGTTLANSTGNVIGTVKNMDANGSLAIPSTPTGGSVSQVGGSGTISATYQVVTTTLQDKSMSIPETVSTTTGPAQLYGAHANQIATPTATATNPVLIFRTALGDTLPTPTPNCCTNGEVTSVSGLPGGTGVSFCPTITFTGSCTTLPTATPQCSGGQVVGLYWTSHGSGCSGTINASFAASPDRLGYIGFTAGTSFNDTGIAGTSLPSWGTSPPSTGLVVAMVDVNPQHISGPFAVNAASLNRAPDTEFKQNAGAYWNLPSGEAVTSNGNTNSSRGGAAVLYTGTGSSIGVTQAAGFMKSALVSGIKYSFSARFMSTNLGTASSSVRICSNVTCSAGQDAGVGSVTAGTDGTSGVVFTSARTGDAYFVWQISGTVGNGLTIGFAEPSLIQTTGGSILPYVENDGPGGNDTVSGIKTGLPMQITNPAAPSTYQTVKSSIQSNGEWDGADILAASGSQYVRSWYFLPWANYANDGKGFYYFESPVQLYPVGGLSPQGSVATYQMPDPSVAPTITHTGAGSSGSPNYYVRFIDSNGRYTLASPAGVDASGYPTPSGGNCNVISWIAPEPGYSNAAVFRGTNLTWVETPGAGVISSLSAGNGLTATTYQDCGTSTEAWSIPTGSAYSNPDANNTDDETVAGRLFVLGTTAFSKLATAYGGITTPWGTTFVCTGGGTITVSDTNVTSTSDITISMAPGGAGGTITTPPAFKTVTAGTGFTVLCGATDTSTYRYRIWN